MGTRSQMSRTSADALYSRYRKSTGVHSHPIPSATPHTRRGQSRCRCYSWLGGPIGFIAWAMVSRNKIPVVLMSESTAIDAERHWPKESVKKRILSLVGAALTGGSRSAQYVATLGMPAERIFVGYDVVDNAYFVQQTARERR